MEALRITEDGYKEIEAVIEEMRKKAEITW
jgi:hypothetical protein